MKRVALVLGLTGCATTGAAPVAFTVRGAPADVARALADAGQPTESVDAEGVVTTRWIDTGLGYGFVGGHPANVFRRYVALVRGDAVTLRLETQRCAQGSWDALAAVGACELLQGLLPRDRQALAEVAMKVRATVGSR